MSKNIKTMEDKLIELDIPKNKWPVFTPAAVDVIYEKIKHTIDIKNMEDKRFLYLLNEILNELDYDKIDSIDKFKVFRSDILELDGENFVNNKRDIMENYSIDINKDLYYFARNNKKSYGLTVLRALSKFYGFSTKTKNKTKYVDGERNTFLYYVLEKNN